MPVQFTIRHAALIALVAVLAMVLSACSDENLPNDILGKWRITDPGGNLVGGTIEFRKTGTMTIVEHLRQGGTIRQNILSGTYRFADDDTIHMDLTGSSGPVSRDVGVGLHDGWLTLHFKGGQIVYRRVG